MNIYINGNIAVAPVRLDDVSISVLPRIEGKKKWVMNGLQFEATKFNLRLFKDHLGAKIIDNRQGEDGDENYKIKYKSKTPPLKHQSEALKKAVKLPHFALWMDVGTGKSWLAIYLMGLRYVNKLITGAIIISPKGVNYQWINEQIPEHISPSIDWIGHVWEKKVSVMDEILKPRKGKLDILSIHIDALDQEKGNETIWSFIRKHEGKLMIIFDEADLIKNYKAIRTRRAMEFRDEARFRLEMTGTPSPKNLEDVWSEFNWLDPDIFGIKYVTAFRREFCIMGGFQGRQITGYRDVERFKSIIDPYIYAVKSEDVGVLPPAYTRWRFDMTKPQRKVYDDIMEQLEHEIEEGKLLTVPDTAVKFLKLQQITSGFLIDTNDKEAKQKPLYKFDNPRLEALLQLIEARNPTKAAIWCRFHYDLDQIMGALPKGSAVEYSGRIRDSEREVAKRRFLDTKSGVRFFVATPGSGGVGLNLQGEARLAVYYSNNYKARERWQSEGRLNRLGAHGQVEIVDLICKGSTDAGILANLRRKKNVQDLAKGDIMRILKGEEE